MLDKLVVDYKKNPRLFATLLGLSVLAAETLIHSLLGFIAAFESLYILPIWLATRFGGRAAGGALVLICASIATMTSIEGGATGPWAPSLLLRLVSYSFVMLLIAHIERALGRNQRLSMTDSLTGLYNRRALDERGPSLFGSARRDSEPLAVAMLDCDGFKSLNDLHGHSAGDAILRLLARTLERGTRSTDMVARVGGDEFAVILRNTDAAEARAIMQRIAKEFESAASEIGYTASISVGLSKMTQASGSLESLLAQADKAMYAHKSLKARRAYLT